jgi:hypothetical protein
MLSRIFSWLFGSCSSGSAQSDADAEFGPPPSPEPKSAPLTNNASSTATPPAATSELREKASARRIRARADARTKEPKAVSPKATKTKKAESPEPDPIDLDIGLDIGTSCTKAVLGDRETNEQTAIPLNGGRKLAGFLLPTQVYLKDGIYSLEPTEGATLLRNLKIRIIHSGTNGNGHSETNAIRDLTAFVALALRRIVKWHSSEPVSRHGNRTPSWNLNVGLPSKGKPNDHFEKIYRGIVEAAIMTVPGTDPITLESVAAATKVPNGTDWLPIGRVHYYPEAAAQLASLIYSPHRPEGCLLVVDVGAGTLDVSTIRIGSRATGVRCSFHFCEVAPLGVHFLHLARRTHVANQDDPAAFDRLLESIPVDDGVTHGEAIPQPDPPSSFHSRCRSVIQGNVVRYRKHLRSKHTSPAYRPWTEGLPYVLSGGGHRDNYFQKVLRVDLEMWLSTVCSEWDQSSTGGPRRGLQLRPFPTPKAFTPRHLAPEFDRFSVAHGLSLGTENLMEVIQARTD